MLASMASEEHADETGLQREEALPAEDQAGKGAAASPTALSPQIRGAEQHLGWKVKAPFTRSFVSAYTCTLSYMHTVRYIGKQLSLKVLMMALSALGTA